MAPQFLNKGGKSDLTSAKAGKKGRRKFLNDKSNARKLSVTEKESSTKGKSCGDLTSSVKQPSTDTPQKNFPAVTEENIPIWIEEEVSFHDHEKCIEGWYRSCLGMSKKFYSSNPADNLETEDELKNEVWTLADMYREIAEDGHSTLMRLPERFPKAPETASRS